jgi:hypothetical protein
VGGKSVVGRADWQAERPVTVHTVIIKKKYLGVKVDTWMIIPD